MMTFKPGDKVVCVEPMRYLEECLVEGEMYTVHTCEYTYGQEFVTLEEVINRAGNNVRYFPRRFKLLETESSMHKFKVGDIVEVTDTNGLGWYTSLGRGHEHKIEALGKSSKGGPVYKISGNERFLAERRLRLIKHDPGLVVIRSKFNDTTLRINSDTKEIVSWCHPSWTGGRWVSINTATYAGYERHVSDDCPLDKRSRGSRYNMFDKDLGYVVRTVGSRPDQAWRPVVWTAPTGTKAWGPVSDEPWTWHPEAQEWYRHGIDPVPKVKLTLAALGLTIYDYPRCCGGKVLGNFGIGVPKKYKHEDIVEGLREIMQTTYGGHGTGMVQAVLNPGQHPEWDKILQDVGFELTSKHPNYVHGAHHYNWLYMWVCEDHKTAVKETKRAFG